MIILLLPVSIAKNASYLFTLVSTPVRLSPLLAKPLCKYVGCFKRRATVNSDIRYGSLLKGDVSSQSKILNISSKSQLGIKTCSVMQ